MADSGKDTDTIDVTETKDGGVLKTIKRHGIGERFAKSGDTVYVHYVGTLAENGEKFDSSRDRAEEFSFALGRGQVIKGWDIGVASMRQGELAVLTCRADYAYGETGSPPKIPPNATLNFEVELLRWSGEDISPDRDGSITRTVIQAGEKYATPSDNASVTVHAVGSYNGRVFFDREVQFVLGEGSEVNLPDGVDKALKRFDRGEQSSIHIKGGKFTYGRNPPAEFNLPVNAELDFMLTLKDFEKVKASWELNGEEKLAAAEEAKERGTHFFQSGKYKLSIEKYKRIEELLEYEKSLEGESKEKCTALLLAARLNTSLAYLKMDETVECIKQCDKALEIAPNNVKALYRRAQALLEQNDLEEAIAGYRKVLAVEANNKAAQQQIAICQHKLAVIHAREKKKFAGMFDKFAAEDKKDEKIDDDDENSAANGDMNGHGGKDETTAMDTRG